MTANHTRRIRENLLSQISRYSEHLQNGCIEWTGAVNKWGYGLINTPKTIRVHRVVASIHLGFDLSSPLFVCHKCDNPRCINPDHLFIGTAISNSFDCITKGRNSKGEMHGRSKLNNDQVRNIRISAARGQHKPDLARQYKVNTATIYKVVNRTSWKHVT
jgi:hypothetical protein